MVSWEKQFEKSHSLGGEIAKKAHNMEIKRRVSEVKKTANLTMVSMILLLLIGMLGVALNIQYVKAGGAIYIRTDGSVDPSTAPIKRDGDIYTLSGNVESDIDGIVIEKDDLTLDGTGYTVQGQEYWTSRGIDMFHRSNITIKNININAFDYGVMIYYSSNISLIRSNITSNTEGGIRFWGSSNNSISENTLTDNNWDGIYAYGSSNNTFADNLISDNYNGITIDGAYNTIYRNILTNNSMNINMPCSYPDARIHNNNVSYNIVTNSTYGIFLGQFGGIPEAIGPTNNTVSNNIIANNEYGIQVHWSDTRDNFLSNNIIANNTHGLFLGGYKNVLRNNMITNNKCNFEASYTFYHDIDTSNTVNGKPIYYLTDQSNIVVDPSTFPNIGYLGIIDAANILVKNLTLAGNGQGLLLVHVTNSTIKNVNISNSTEGIYMYGSTSNNITDNVIANNSGAGINMESSQNNTFQGNFLSNNSEALYLHGSHGNFIRNNTIANNGGGIYMDYSKENIVYHNNFINNTWQAKTYGYSDKWDNGFEGNYWSDYTDVDSYSEPYQNETGSDGIWDHPYVIDGNNKDNYPLVSPYWYWSNPIPGDINKDMKVDANDLISAAKAFGSYPGHPRWNSLADINHDDKVNVKDIVSIGRNFGKTYT